MATFPEIPEELCFYAWLNLYIIFILLYLVLQNFLSIAWSSRAQCTYYVLGSWPPRCHPQWLQRITSEAAYWRKYFPSGYIVRECSLICSRYSFYPPALSPSWENCHSQRLQGAHSASGNSVWVWYLPSANVSNDITHCRNMFLMIRKGMELKGWKMCMVDQGMDQADRDKGDQDE